MPSGILIIDKPAGWTSMDVCAKVRGIFHEKRVGHGGTLDPMAAGGWRSWTCPLCWSPPDRPGRLDAETSGASAFFLQYGPEPLRGEPCCGMLERKAI